jgi:hypothetical protein
MFGGKRQIAPDQQAELAADGKSRKADATEFEKALTKGTETEGNVPFLRINLTEEPGAVRIRR